LGSIYRVGIEYGAVKNKDPDPDIIMRLRETLDGVTDMLYKRTSISYEVPFSELLMSADESPEEGTMLALTDESSASQVLQPELTSNADNLAQGLEQVQMYEEQQRQDLAAEQGAEVIEPDQAMVQEAVTPAQAEVIEAQSVVQEEVKPA
jgi:hypothetical protein